MDPSVSQLTPPHNVPLTISTSTPLQNGLNDLDAVEDSSDDLEDGYASSCISEASEEDIGDYLRSFDDAFHSQSDLLQLETAAGISLDMDAEDLGLEVNVNDSDSDLDSDSDNSNGGLDSLFT